MNDKKRIKLLWSIGLTFAFSSPAFPQLEYQPNSDEYKAALKGLPLPDSGITIVSGISKSIPKRFQDEERKRREQQKSQGFSFSNTSHPRDLMYLSKTVGENNKMFATNSDPKSTQIKKTLGQLSIGFPFSGIRDSQAKPIGYAVMGAWTNRGWSGVVEYFQYPELGTCQLSLNNIRLSHAAIELDREIISYDINDKVTTKFAEGSHSSGFLYTVNWYDKKFFYQLECAKEKFDSQVIGKMTHLAIAIDQEMDS